MRTTPDKLPEAEQRQWLEQHIPHRVAAAISGLNVPIWQGGFPNLLGNSTACAVHEGRMAAVRWLIYMAGVKLDSKGAPANHKLDQCDVDLTCFIGGSLIDKTDGRAPVLAAAWKGCSQATAHPTSGSNHPDVSAAALVAPVTILIQHLEATVYAAAGMNLAEWVKHVCKG